MDGGALEECVDSQVLVDYVNGELTCEEAIRIDRHLGTCDKCVEKVRLARNTVFFVEHLTARAHGAAHAAAAQEPALDLASEATAWLERLRSWLGEALTPATPQFATSSEKRPPPLDNELCAQVPTLLGDGQQSHDTMIDVLDPPPVLNPEGSLVFILRIPLPKPEVPQKLALQLLSVDERRPIGAAIEVVPGQKLKASFKIPERLWEQWRKVGEKEPKSWPFRFALRIPSKKPRPGASEDP